MPIERLPWQAALPCLLLAGQSGGFASSDAGDGSQSLIEGVSSVLRLRGGTDAAMAPPVGYAQHVLLPLLRRQLGIDVSLQVIRRGYFPKARA